ncbi:Spy/CpxP family protein refolding chaperone [Massilia endophytica]|uniref:Spy/CpxP family protein refolding chaperone n=1 Tax=Massilia endophytica TaxID=2899220 RepID=UPI001E488BC3|nr:Spy/CpxP family protein refolding chaperone [Massilia endophytica]UGQ48436.1 Spy/CpxP family protein refolding chaperone [Massilia endophytica]
MNKTRQGLHGLLLAAAIAMPLAALADTDADDAPVPPGPRARHAGPADGPEAPGPRGFAPPPFPGMATEPPFMRGLELTEAQQDQVFAILHGQIPYLREQGKAHQKAERALDAMHNEGRFDEAAAAKLAHASAQAMANITMQQLRTEQKLLAVLTPEQRKQLQERKSLRMPIRPAAPPA